MAIEERGAAILKAEAVAHRIERLEAQVVESKLESQKQSEAAERERQAAKDVARAWEKTVVDYESGDKNTSDLHAEIDAKEDALIDMETKFMAMEKTNQKLTSRLEENEKTMIHAEETAANYGKLKSEMEINNIEYLEVQKSLEETRTSIDTSTIEKERLECDVVKLEESLAENRGELRILSDLKALQGAELEKQREKILALKADLEAEIDLKGRVQVENDNLRRAVASGTAFESKVEQLLQTVGEKNEIIANVEAECEKRVKEAQRLQDRVNQLEREIFDSQKENEKKTVELISAHAHEREEREEEERGKRAKEEAFKLEYSKLVDVLKAELVAEQEMKGEEIGSLKESLATEKGRNEAMEKEKTDTKQDHEAAIKKLQERLQGALNVNTEALASLKPES